MLAQRAVADSPRWTRAVEDQSAPILEEVTSELGQTVGGVLEKWWLTPFDMSNGDARFHALRSS